MTELSEDKPSLQHLPVSLFASVMGLSGLAIATQKLEGVFSLDAWASSAFLAMSGFVWLGLFLAYVVKILRFPRAVLAELNHPIRLSFFPTISIGVLLLSIGLIQLFPMAAQLLWWIGAAAQLIFTLLILDRWIHHEHFKTEHNSPAWFIPIVGNILVPVAGAEFGYAEISYFFFALGIIFWLPLMAISLNRAFFFSAIPKRLLPTLFILIAPPAVGFISWLKLHSGNLDDFGIILFYVAAFLLLMLVVQARHFIRLPFALPWWAYTFPLAAMDIAAFAFYSLIPQPHYLYFAVSLYVVLSLVVLLVSYRTIRAGIKGSIFLPE
jgi:tellurite resistance protein